MGLLAELGRLSIGAWSPGGSGGGYIATGTYAGSVETSFTDSIALELLSVDIQRSKLIPLASLKSPAKFDSLDWANPTRSHQAGLIAGGLADGTVRVWDAASLIRAPKSPDEKFALIYSSSTSDPVKHTAPVRVLQFNPFLNNFLASGGADGQIFVWDLSNPSAGVSPRHPASKSASVLPPSSKDEITTLAWNRKVPNILSTATNAGVTNVWDLKQSRQVISIRNPRGRLRCSSLAWHPEIATQIVITCDEDDSTAALLWDLRNATAPVSSFAHHAPKGIVSASWNPHDSDLLLTSSKDSRTVVVSVSSNEVIADSSTRSSDWNFDVKWSPRIPGLYLASSVDGRLSVNSMLAASSAPSVSSATATALAESFGENAGDFRSGMADQSPRTTDSQRVIYSVTKPPKWLKRPSSMSFAFGGWKAHFSSKNGQNITIDSFAEEIPSVSEIPDKLDKMLMDLTANDPSPAEQWCQAQSTAAETPKDKLGWDMLAILFSKDSRRKLIEYLGFSLPPKDACDDITMPVYGLLQSQPIAVPVRSVPSDEPVPPVAPDVPDTNNGVTNGISDMKLDGPAPWDVSDSFGAGGDDTKASILDGDDSSQLINGAKDTINAKTQPNGNGKSDPSKLFMGKSASEVDTIIKKAVIVGDFKTAVDACLHAGKAADALVIAHAGGPDLWVHAQGEYLSKASVSSGSKVIGAIAGPKEKMDDYIRQAAESGKESWKEALAAILTYNPAEELYEACTALGNRLLDSKNETGALACFLCASNVGMVSSAWMERLETRGKSSTALMVDRVKHLNAVVERVRLFTAAVVLSQGEHEIGAVRALDEPSGAVLCEFGALLTIQSNYSAAITYLSNLNPSYTCVYGSAEDLNRKASDCFALSDSSNVDNSPFSGTNADPNANNSTNTTNTFNPGYGSYSSVYNNAPAPQPPAPPQSIGYNSSPYGIPPPTTTNNMIGGGLTSPVVPPPPTSMYNSAPAPTPAPLSPVVPPPPSVGNMNGSAPVPPPVGLAPIPPPVGPAPIPPPVGPAPIRPTGPTVLPERNTMRPSRDVKSAYDEAPVANVPPPPNMGNIGMTPAAPYPPTPMQGLGTPSGVNPVNGTTPYDGPAAVGTSPMNAMGQAMPPPPPLPPPPTDGEGPPPSSFYSKAKQGAGAKLPPSAEVAVAEGRRERAPSSSGTPGGPPRRSTSISSSISSLVTETVYLDKMDVSKLGANEMMIVKVLRISLTQAQGMNQSGMYRRKMDDINKRLGKLAAGLNAGLLDKDIVDKLVAIASAIEKPNLPEAQGILAVLSKEYWDTNRQWIQGLKWLLECVARGR